MTAPTVTTAPAGPRALLEAARAARAAGGGKPLPPAGFLDAPELGAGARLPLRMLSIGDRMRMVEIYDGARNQVELFRAFLPVVVCEPDGSPTFADPPTPADLELIAAFPWPLAERAADEALRLSRAGGGAAGPKAGPQPSPPTPG